MHRRNYEPWRVSMYLQNFQRMYSDDIFDELKAQIRGGIITCCWIHGSAITGTGRREGDGLG